MKERFFPDGVRSPTVVPPTSLTKGWTQKVLDHGYVKFIDSMGTDETIVEAARMSTQRGFVSWEPYWRCEKCGSTDSESALKNTLCSGYGTGPHAPRHFPCGDLGLLTSLYRDRHMTPFEMCELHIEVKAPLFVFREWHRHRTQSYNEMSARYVQMPNEHYVPALNRFEAKQTGNKQADSLRHAQNITGPVAADMREQVAEAQKEIYGEYEFMLGAGVPKEVARINTPVSRYSVMRAKTDLRNWLAFLTLRDESHAQWEIQQYAKAVAAIVKDLWPRTYELFEEYTKHAVTLSRSDAQEVKQVLEALSVTGNDADREQLARLLAKFK